MEDVHVSSQPTQDRRCPYCHDEVSLDDGMNCGTCDVLHHPTCFTEHGGCSVHGCDSHTAQAGEAPGLHGQVRAAVAHGATGSSAQGFAFLRRGFSATLSCSVCTQPCESDPLVARCSGCGGTQHADCYETSGGCPSSTCRTAEFPVNLLTPQNVQWRNRQAVGLSLRNIGLILGLPMALCVVALLALGESPILALFGLPFWLAGTIGLLTLRSLGDPPPAQTPPEPPAKLKP